jgi:hypothetical protein
LLWRSHHDRTFLVLSGLGSGFLARRHHLLVLLDKSISRRAPIPVLRVFGAHHDRTSVPAPRLSGQEARQPQNQEYADEQPDKTGHPYAEVLTFPIIGALRKTQLDQCSLLCDTCIA